MLDNLIYTGIPTTYFIGRDSLIQAKVIRYFPGPGSDREASEPDYSMIINNSGGDLAKLTDSKARGG